MGVIQQPRVPATAPGISAELIKNIAVVETVAAKAAEQTAA